MWWPARGEADSVDIIENLSLRHPIRCELPLNLDHFFAALADPTRRAVIEKLTAGPVSVSVLAAPHDMALPTFLRHLKVLEKAGVVRSVKKGRVRTCQIDPETLISAQGWLAWQRAVWENKMDSKDQLAFPLEAGCDNSTP